MIGDVVAKPGRVAVLERIQDMREQHDIDLAIMNAENLAGGFSVTPSLCEELFANGIDVMTSGNHIFDKKEAIPYIAKQPQTDSARKLSTRHARQRDVDRKR